MSFILLLLFLAVIFRTGLGFIRFLIPILLFLFVIALFVHLWWILLLVIPFMLLFRSRKEPVRNNVSSNEKRNSTVDGEYEEVDDK